jgi:dienelactone hydrolase
MNKLSLMHNIDAKTPPTILYFDDSDQYLPVVTVDAYQQAMEAAGVRCDSFIYSNKGHEFFNYLVGGNAAKNKFFNETMKETVSFLKSVRVL